MAYNSDYLGCVNPGASKGQAKIFTYRTDDAEASIDNSGYISDGVDYGMAVGDIVFVQKVDDLGTPTTFETEVWHVASVSGSAATIAQGGTIS